MQNNHKNIAIMLNISKKTHNDHKEMQNNYRGIKQPWKDQKTQSGTSKSPKDIKWLKKIQQRDKQQQQQTLH